MLFSFEMEKSTPYAPKELEGEYKLVINGRKMQLTKVADGIKTHATCNKTDNWNMVDGINICLERMNDKKKYTAIKVGDTVEVIDEGRNYPHYVDWVVRNVKDPVEIARFVNCDNQKLNGRVGKVLAIASWGGGSVRTLAYVQIKDKDADKNYLIDVKGLKKI